MLLPKLGGFWLLPPRDFPHLNESHPMDHDSDSSGHANKLKPDASPVSDWNSPRNRRIRTVYDGWPEMDGIQAHSRKSGRESRRVSEREREIVKIDWSALVSRRALT